MATEEKTAAPATTATVVATAALTLAIGVTVAALGGYLVPAGDGARTTPVTQTNAVEAQRAASPSGPSVVLVPVAPDARPDAPVPAEPPEVLLAAYEPTKHDDDDPRGKRHDRRHDKHHEDDHDFDN